MKQVLRDIPDAPPALGPYSPGVAAGPFVFVSGMTPYDPATGKIERGTIARQTELVLENIGRVLAAGGAGFADVVSCRVFLSTMGPEIFAEMNSVYSRYFPSNHPARTTICAQLPGAFDVEIECIAFKSGANTL